MPSEVVSSFPYAEWAHELVNALRGKGIDAAAEEAGQRAYPVYVDAKDVDKAMEVLDSIGYLTCGITVGRAALGASLGNVLEWDPDEKELEKDQEFVHEVEDHIDRIIDDKANKSSAMWWSAPIADQWTVAQFGDAIAINGYLYKRPEAAATHVPEGFVLTERGGLVPTTSLHIQREVVLHEVLSDFKDFPRNLIMRIFNRHWEVDLDARLQIQATVSGRTVVYEKRKP